MASRIAIAVTAVIAITVGSTLGASAMHGGGGMGHGGMGHGGMGGWHGGFGHSGFSHGFHHGFAFRHDRDDHFHFRHRFFRNEFVFAGVPYGYDDGCYVRVWTRWGWRLRSVCY
jgi:hypothetical protein